METIGSSFWGSYLESEKAIPKRNYYGAYGYTPPHAEVHAASLSPRAIVSTAPRPAGIFLRVQRVNCPGFRCFQVQDVILL